MQGCPCTQSPSSVSPAPVFPTPTLKNRMVTVFSFPVCKDFKNTRERGKKEHENVRERNKKKKKKLEKKCRDMPDVDEGGEETKVNTENDRKKTSFFSPYIAAAAFISRFRWWCWVACSRLHGQMYVQYVTIIIK